MLGTKIRTTFAVLAATFSVAGFAVVPTASQAMGIKMIVKAHKVTVCHEETILTPYGFASRTVCETRLVVQ